MDAELEVIYNALRGGNTKEAIENLHDYCENHFDKYLDEVISFSTRLHLIHKSERLGNISFAEVMKLENQVSTSVLKLLHLLKIEAPNSNRKTSSELQIKLDAERKEKEELLEKLKQIETRVEKVISNNKIPTIKTDEQPKKASYSTSIRKSALKIEALSKSVVKGKGYCVVLGEIDGKRKLPILISESEAHALALAFKGKRPDRPLVHKFFNLQETGYSIKEVLINNLLDGEFHSRLILIKNQENLDLEWKISEAFILSTLLGVPIFTYDFIMDAASVTLED